MPFRDGDETPLLFTESPPSFDPSYDLPVDRAQEGQLEQQMYDHMSYQHGFTAPNVAQSQLRQIEVAYPGAVYTLNDDDDRSHRPQSLVDPNVQHSAYALVSAQPINHMNGGEARLRPVTGFNDGFNAVEGDYGSPSYGMGGFQGYLNLYGQPNNLTSRQSNSADTLPITSYGGNIKAVPTPFRQPVNAGTGVRFVKPNTIDHTQLTRRIDSAPHLSRVHPFGAEAPWTGHSTYGLPVTQQQSVSSVASNTNLGQPAGSIHDHLLGPVAVRDPLDRLRMTGYKHFRDPSCLRGSEEAKGKRQQHP